MSKLIVCLGYRLESDGSMSPILENRLTDTVNLCNENEESTLLLMGGFSYHGLRKFTTSESSLMDQFLKDKFNQKIKNTKIITEEKTTSTIEQLCYLKDFMKKEKFNYSDLIIVSSKYFTDRVKLYAEYIFGTTNGILFVGSGIPENLEACFKRTEKFKLTATPFLRLLSVF